MEFIFEAIFQVLLELILQMVFELAAEFGVRAMADPFRRQPHPIVSTIGYLIWGSLAGAISLWLFPASAIHSGVLREVNVIVTPVAIGFLMVLVGLRRTKKGQTIVRLDRFWFAYVFAFAMAMVRYIWAV